MNGDQSKYYGKYRGTVIQNQDPERRGRIQVEVPDVLSLIPSTWAEPSVPWTGGPGVPMGFFLLPAIGAGVWIEFEHGDVDKPIWTGCRWGLQSEIPTLAQFPNPVSPNVVIQTMLQNSLTISDMPPTPATGGIVLKSATGAMIVVNDSGIYIQNGKGASIFLTGPTVTINNGALVIV